MPAELCSLDSSNLGRLNLKSFEQSLAKSSVFVLLKLGNIKKIFAFNLGYFVERFQEQSVCALSRN